MNRVRGHGDATVAPRSAGGGTGRGGQACEPAEEEGKGLGGGAGRQGWTEESGAVHQLGLQKLSSGNEKERPCDKSFISGLTSLRPGPPRAEFLLHGGGCCRAASVTAPGTDPAQDPRLIRRVLPTLLLSH